MIAFYELKDMLEKSAGTVQTNLQEHKTILTSDKSQHNLEEKQPCQEKRIVQEKQTAVGCVPPEIVKKLLCETFPPDRTKEMKN